MPLMRMFVGLDWASAEHALCVLDERGQVRARDDAQVLSDQAARGAPVPWCLHRPDGGDVADRTRVRSSQDANKLGA